MGIYDLSPVYNVTTAGSLEGIGTVKQRKTSKGRDSYAYDYMQAELEELRGKKKALSEADTGPETGYNPARDIGYNRVLVDNEGVLIAEERAVRAAQERGIKEGLPPSTKFYTPAEEEVWREYSNQRGTQMVEYWGTYKDTMSKKEKKDAEWEYKVIETNWGQQTYAWEGDYDLWLSGAITHRQLIARSYHTKLAINLLKEGIIEEYKSKKMLDPSINISIY